MHDVLGTSVTDAALCAASHQCGATQVQYRACHNLCYLPHSCDLCCMRAKANRLGVILPNAGCSPVGFFLLAQRDQGTPVVLNAVNHTFMKKFIKIAIVGGFSYAHAFQHSRIHDSNKQTGTGVPEHPLRCTKSGNHKKKCLSVIRRQLACILRYLILIFMFRYSP